MQSPALALHFPKIYLIIKQKKWKNLRVSYCPRRITKLRGVSARTVYGYKILPLGLSKASTEEERVLITSGSKISAAYTFNSTKTESIPN